MTMTDQDLFRLVFIKYIETRLKYHHSALKRLDMNFLVKANDFDIFAINRTKICMASKKIWKIIAFSKVMMTI